MWAKASIIGPVKIGDRAVIGAHALVMDDVPPGAVTRGVPARSYLDGRPVPKAASAAGGPARNGESADWGAATTETAFRPA